jgi:hypothetical protein
MIWFRTNRKSPLPLSTEPVPVVTLPVPPIFTKASSPRLIIHEPENPEFGRRKLMQTVEQRSLFRDEIIAHLFYPLFTKINLFYNPKNCSSLRGLNISSLKISHKSLSHHYLNFIDLG